MITKTFVVTPLLFLVLLLAVGLFIAEHNNGLETLTSFDVIECLNGSSGRYHHLLLVKEEEEEEEEEENNNNSKK